MTPSDIREWVGPVVELLGALAAFCGFAWGLLRKGQKYVEVQKNLVEAVRTLNVSVSDARKEAAQTTYEVARLKVSLDQREREISRLEGKLQTVHTDYKENAAKLYEVIGQLAALWKTLQTLHPDRVPKRASDS